MPAVARGLWRRMRGATDVVEDEEEEDDGVALVGTGAAKSRRETALTDEASTRAASRGYLYFKVLFACFAALWVCGCEWYPFNAFRMFAGYVGRAVVLALSCPSRRRRTQSNAARMSSDGARAAERRVVVRRYDTSPIEYDGYAARDASGKRVSLWYPAQLNPVMNQHRLLGALEACAADAKGDRCLEFVPFARAAAAGLPGAPASIELQRRTWDYARDDASGDPEYCDAMTTWSFRVADGAVTKTVGVACDAVDLSPLPIPNMGTI